MQLRLCCMIALLPGTVALLLQSCTVTRVSQQQAPLSPRLLAVRHPSKKAPHNDFIVQAPSPRLSAPQMSQQTGLIATAAAAATNAAIAALDGLAACLKISWRLAAWLLVGLALKPVWQPILNYPPIARYAKQVKLVHLKWYIALGFYPLALRLARRLVFRIFTLFPQVEGAMARRPGRRGMSRKKQSRSGGGDGDGGEGTAAGSGGGSGRGGGEGSGGGGGGNGGGGGDGGQGGDSGGDGNAPLSSQRPPSPRKKARQAARMANEAAEAAREAAEAAVAATTLDEVKEAVEAAQEAAAEAATKAVEAKEFAVARDADEGAVAAALDAKRAAKRAALEVEKAEKAAQAFGAK